MLYYKEYWDVLYLNKNLGSIWINQHKIILIDFLNLIQSIY